MSRTLTVLALPVTTLSLATVIFSNPMGTESLQSPITAAHIPQTVVEMRLAEAGAPVFGAVPVGAASGGRQGAGEPVIVEAFRQQLADRLFKMWTTVDLEPGEYALVQYTEGKMNLQIWDFRIE